MSATHAGRTSGGNLCHLFVRRARNLAMSKSVASVVVMRLPSAVARPLGRRGSAELSPGGDAYTTPGARLVKTVVPKGALERRVTGRCRPWHSGRLHPRGGDDERSAAAPRRRVRRR